MDTLRETDPVVFCGVDERVNVSGICAPATGTSTEMAGRIWWFDSI